MSPVELIQALIAKGAAPSPAGCVVVLRSNWEAVKNNPPPVPDPKLSAKYAYWPDHEAPAEDDPAWY